LAASVTTIGYLTDDTFVVPAGVVSIHVRGWGGGAGGTIAPLTNTTGGGGGGSGAYFEGDMAVTPTNTVTITVGQGGVADAAGNPTVVTNGTDTFTADGGDASPSLGVGGLGGTASGGAAVELTGQRGADGTAILDTDGKIVISQVSGAGGSAPLGGAGDYTFGSSFGGVTPGGGGDGAGTNPLKDPGPGGNGLVILEYITIGPI